MGIVPCCWKHSWMPPASVEPATGPLTGSAWDRPPGAVVWTGSTKPMGKPSKTSTSIPWYAMHASVYAAIPPGKQILNLLHSLNQLCHRPLHGPDILKMPPSLFHFLAVGVTG